MAQYNNFIPENVAPKTAKRIGLYDSNGNRVLSILLGHLAFPMSGEKLYSFGALSDVHLGKAEDENEQEDFSRALIYLNNDEDVSFICICGDLTEGGLTTQLAEFKDYIVRYSTNKPVYAVTGNHDAWNGSIENQIATYTGHPLYYSFTHGNDVFIMVGIKNDTDVFRLF